MWEIAQMAQRIHRGFWLLRVVLLSASLVGVLLMIEQFRHQKVSFEPLVPAGAEVRSESSIENGIGAKVINDRNIKKDIPKH